MNDAIYFYDGTFYGFLCCIFDSYQYRESPMEILCEDQALPCLFSCRTVTTNPDHARRVLKKAAQLSSRAPLFFYKGFLTCLPQKEILLYRIFVKLLQEGAHYLMHRTDPVLYPMVCAIRHLNGEAHQYKGFLRFSELGGILVSTIEPKNRVLPLLRSHFANRCLNETFLIYDKTHREALFYHDGTSSIAPLEDFQPAVPEEKEEFYRQLWRCFYQTVSIQERENPKGRATHMPKRYWSCMTEFYAPSTEGNKHEGAPALSAPNGKSAPGIRQEPARSAPV